MNLPGLHAYAEQSVTAGEPIHFRVSSTVPYQLSVRKLGPQIDDRNGDVVLHAFHLSPAQPQPIHPGSFVVIDKPLPAETPLTALTLECWVRPFRIEGATQGLIAQHDYPRQAGVGLFLGDRGKVQFYLGAGGEFRPEWLHAAGGLAANRWHHVVGTWDGDVKHLFVDGKRVGQWPHASQVVPGAAPLLLGGYLESGEACNTLDGDLALPAIYGRALSAEEVAARFSAKALQTSPTDRLLACWPLTEERGDRLADIGDHQRHGRIVNRGTWMVGGPSFDAAAMPLHGDYDPAKDASRGHGLRLACDDLYDCGWPVTHEFKVPSDAKSGLYIGQFDFQWDGKPCVYHVTFNVRRPADRPKAPILVLLATNTWLAYSATPFAANGLTARTIDTDGVENSLPAAPAYSCYRNHHGGQPTYQLGLNVPWPVAGPDVTFCPPGVGYSHLMRGERFLHVWLDEAGYSFDVVTDSDLHRDPHLLQGYKTMVINGHSEYWSAEAYDGVDRYLRNGGTAIVLSGNTMFWRVSFDPQGAVMECRKHDPAIGGRESATPGELYHADDGRRGSLLRECGRPAWKVLGLECIGWWGSGPNDFLAYETVAADHPLFREPAAVELTNGQSFGSAGEGKLPGAVGHETDVRVSQIVAITKDFPPGVEVPQDPAGIQVLARSGRPGTRGISYMGHWVDNPTGLRAEMIYWERPQGGRVFHFGSIGVAWALTADPKLAMLLRNVLHRFGVY